MVLKSPDEFTGVSERDVCAALTAGACLITANNRLARAWHLRYARSREAAGIHVWEAPDILPWSAYVSRAAGLMRAQASHATPALTAAQERFLWADLAHNRDDGFLCGPEAFGALAADAWQLLADYDLAVPPPGADLESETFAALAQGFGRRLAALGREDPARDGMRVARALRAGLLSPGRQVLWAGFQDLTPVQLAVHDACGAAGAVCRRLPLPDIESRGAARIYLALEAEITAALLWARERARAHPDGHYALIVPDLVRLRTPLARAAHEVFGTPEAGGLPYELSLGAPLARAPVVIAALRVLRLMVGGLPAADAAALIQSPYLTGAPRARWSRAAAACGLLDTARMVDLQRLGQALRTDEAGLGAVCARLAGLRRRWPRTAAPSRCVELFSAALAAAGWPGTAGPADREAVAALNEVWSAVAGLDAVSGAQAPQDVLAMAGEWLSGQVFQPSGGDGAIRIMGPLEAVGLSFDGLWVMNLHDRAWPVVQPPHPLLPLAFQRAHGLPHARIEDDIRYAQRLVHALTRAAPEVVLTCAWHDGTEAQRPSQALAAYAPETAPVPVFMSRAQTRYVSRGPREPIPDRPVPLGQVPGRTYGAGLFTAQARCPFQAFAQYRLRAQPLQRPGYGPGKGDRGTVLHRVLEQWFRKFPEVGSWQGLSEQERDLCITEVVSLAQARERDRYGAMSEAFVALEAQRMARLLREFLDGERDRAPFRVLGCEQVVTWTCGGLEIKGRIDRIDEVAGERIVIDYKTGATPTVDWTVARPAHPQLLFYAAAQGVPVAGIAYAKIGAREMGYKAWVRRPGLLPGAEVVNDWPTVTAAWKDLLEGLAQDFVAGRADVDPLPDACAHCGRESLCRVRDEMGDDT